MAVLKLGNILAVGADNVVVQSKYVKGTYTVWDTIANRDAWHTADDTTIINGSLCYVTATDKFYKYSGTAWEECTILVETDGESIQLNQDGELQVKVLTNGGLEIYSVSGTSGLSLKLADNSGLSLSSSGVAVDTATIATKSSVDSLDARVTNLEARGRFLSSWDAATGKPGDYPSIAVGATYTYKTGDYYIVSNVPATGTKYKPAGTGIERTGESTYVVPTAEETSEVGTNDEYLYTTSGWVLIHTPQKEVVWGSIGGTLSNQTDLSTALNSKIEGVKVGDTTATISNKIAEFEAEEAGDLALLDEVSENELEATLKTKIDSIANKQVGTKVNGTELTKDTDGKVNISLESELTFDTSTNKIKITRPSTANGQVLTAKSDGTVAWETVGTGDILFKDSNKSNFATKAEFDTAAASGTFYLTDGTQKSSALIVKGDYVIITADETHSGSQARYGYQAAAGSYSASSWVFEYTLGSAYTGENGVQINGTVISAKLDGTSLAASANGLKINDGWTSGSAMILDGGNASLTDPTE